MKDLKTLRRMIGHMAYILTDKQKKQMVGMFVVILLGAAFDLLGVTMMLPFIQSILAPEELLQKPYIAFLADVFGVQGGNDLIALVGVALIIIYVVKNVYLMVSAYLQASYSANTQRELAVFMLESYTWRPYSFFVENNSSELLRGVTSDVARIYSVIKDFFKFLSEVLVIIAIAIYLITVDFAMAISVLVVGAVCFGIIICVLKKRISKLGAENRAADAKTSKSALQTISGIKDIFVFNKREYFSDAYDNAYKERCRIDTQYVFANSAPERIIEGFCISGIIVIVLVRLKMGVDPAVFVPKLAVFAMSAFRILPSIARVTGYTSTFMYARTSVEAAYNDIKSSREYMKSLADISIEEEVKSDYELSSGISVDSITWKYENNDKIILDNLSLTINKGEAIGLIGESGAGKSTLADILLTLYKPQSGSICMDGMDIFGIPNLWSECVSYVPQTVFILDDTIKANVAFGEEDIDEDRVWQALEKANIAHYIRKMPDGLNTLVGERGIKFSGGQRQRLAIARALYRNPQILILDEATSALDNDTENAVMDAINALQGTITLIIIAHRLTTIANCDKIYEIKSGKAIERDISEVLDK